MTYVSCVTPCVSCVAPVCLCVLWLPVLSLRWELAAVVTGQTWLWLLEAPGLSAPQDMKGPVSCQPLSLSDPDHVCTFLVLLPFVYFTAQRPSHLHIHAPTWTPLIMQIETHPILYWLCWVTIKHGLASFCCPFPFVCPGLEPGLWQLPSWI